MLQKIIKIAYMLDVNGYAKEADLMDKLLIRLSQTPGPFNADIPLNSRVVPFADLDEEFKDVQKERENFPRFDQDYYDITPQDDKDDEKGSIFGMNDENTINGPAFIYPDMRSPGMSSNLDNFKWENWRRDDIPYRKYTP